MDQSKLKKYAPQARLDFIAAVTERAAFYGLTSEGIEPVVSKGDVIIIGQAAFPRDVAAKREKLEERIQRDGFQQTMEAMAYSWFNRFAAIRYMELHGYLDHGYRVLSHPEGLEQPEILEHAADLELSGLDSDKVVDLKLEGNKDEELYRLLLIAQCNALHNAMPFLFEEIGSATELLLPTNLLHTDSLVRQLVESIDESAWDEIEIIGWLYQFYISEKKDQVIGKVVKSEDIPAATQLFTPNWIVKYMVQNSLGAQWLATYPNSKLKEKMEYYIEPAEQTDEVNAQLAAITPSQLDPKELTLIDPASGSGHILVEAYELFKEIYLERGYQKREVPQLILEKNLFGLDIDERAAQLTGFALMMKGRADDRRLFERELNLNVMALVDSTDFDAERLVEEVELWNYELAPADLTELKRLFEHATTFGSLILVPEELAKKLPTFRQLCESISQDLFVSYALKRLKRLVRQAEMLVSQYDFVVANPPYMGVGGMNEQLKSYLRKTYADFAVDVCTAFMQRSFLWLPETGMSAQVNLQKWMFQSTFSPMRQVLLNTHSIEKLVQIGFNSFPTINSKIALGCAFVLRGTKIDGFVGRYVDLNSAAKSADKGLVFRERNVALDYKVVQSLFLQIPDAPIAYWGQYGDFFRGDLLGETLESGGRCKTHADDRYVRYHWEVADHGISGNTKWRFYEKGGDFRKWYGNRLFVVNWSEAARASYSSKGGLTQERFWNRIGVSWSDVALQSGFRLKMEDTEFSSVSPTIFASENSSLDLRLLLLLNSTVVKWAMRALNPSIHANPGDILKLPKVLLGSSESAERAIAIAKYDWDLYETSREFLRSPNVGPGAGSLQLEGSIKQLIQNQENAVSELRVIEEANNKRYVAHFNLEGEVATEVSLAELSLSCNSAYRYSTKSTEEELEALHLRDALKELVSYAIGCMMGRYSLDEPGLIYAHSGNEGFDSSRYTSFPADDDGIIPLTDTEWFNDDAANRLVTFMSVAWDSANLEENLKFLASNLSPKKSESSRETIRRYLCDKFFKDHLQTYKNRPIYWLFSSGRQKAFQCLVYLHRYNEGTLARMRTEYVVPLQGMMASRVRQLDGDITAADSTVHRKRLEKEKSTLVKQQTELQQYDEKLRHFADQRIPLDLDDGVKVNYGKFSSLLAEVKKVTGKNPD